MTKVTHFVPVAILVLLTSMARLDAADKSRGLRGEDRITHEVRHELAMLPYYSVFDNLEFQVTGSTVTLSGQVTRPTLKSDAAAAVKQVEGVERVDNRIEILPVSPNDDRIRRAEFFRLYSQNSPLFHYGWGSVPPIHIIVRNGHVTLTGVVDNQTDKNTANLLANQVPGVFSVTNHLQVGKS